MWDRTRRLLVAACWVVPFAAFAGGDPIEAEPPPVAADCAHEIAARVQAYYDDVRDLGARFDQRTESPAFPEPQTASGRVEFAKPGMMRWEYQLPQPSLVVSDGATLWIVDPVAKEVQILTVDEAFLSGTAIHFLLGEGRIVDAFDVSARECASEVAILRLDPKRAATYEYLEVRVAAGTGEIRGTHIADLLGNHTHVEFRDLELNQSPAETRFRYEPAADERVMRLAP